MYFVHLACAWTLALPAPAQARAPALTPGLPQRVQPERIYRGALDRAIATLRGKGGLVRLRPDLRTLVIPDLHGRRDYLVRVLTRRDPQTGARYASLLRRGELQVVLLGDGMHTERAARWARAERDPRGPAMRQEAAESLGTMKLVMELKAAHPEHFHYLKGNHDNILDERRRGNWPVSKHTEQGEGALTRSYLEGRFGGGLVERWQRFESLLPVVAVGNGFALAHSGPERVARRRAIQRRQATAVENFTWTDLTGRGAQQARMARQQLRELGVPEGFFLAGHREAPRVRRQGQFFQLNSADQMYFAVLEPGRAFDPARDLFNAAR